jgi:hypothetical protein
VVVAAVAQHHVRAAPGPAAFAPDGWHGLGQGDQLGDVAKAITDHMVPRAEAWRSGADTGTADQLKAFGNDLEDPRSSSRNRRSSLT